MQQVYHVVTEREIKLGQKILFDENHHNGVFKRVDAYQKVVNNQEIQDELKQLILSNMDYWGKVASRELALEKVRKEKYPFYPSRMACLYTSRTFEEAKSWAQFFDEIGRKVFSIVKLNVDGNIFDGDACNCFDGNGSDEDLQKAELYWQKAKTEKPVIETLVDGDITVVELIEWDKLKHE